MQAGEGIPQERWRDSWRSHTGNTPDAKRRSVTHNAPMFQPREISALEIAAEQVRNSFMIQFHEHGPQHNGNIPLTF